MAEPQRWDSRDLLSGCMAAVASLSSDWRRWLMSGAPESALRVEGSREAQEARTARKHFQAAVSAHPTWPLAHAFLGILCQHWPPQDLECARRHLEQAVALQPTSQPGALALAVLEMEQAPGLHSCSGRCDAEQHLMLERAAEMVERNRHRQRALQLLRTTLALAPSNAEAHLALGVQLEGSAEAIDHLQRVIRLAPNSRTMVSHVIGEMRYFGRGRDAEAILADAAAAGLWKVPFQRTSIFWPSLPVAVYPSILQLQRAKAVFESHWNAVRPELLDLWQRRKLVFFPSYAPCSAGSICREYGVLILPARYRYAGSWEEGHVYSGESMGSTWQAASWQAASCTRHAPVTCNALREFASASGLHVLRSSVSVVHGPVTRIPRHNSVVQGLLRFHCPVRIPAGARSLLRFGSNDSIIHKESECFWFDETVEHELIYNSGGGERVLFMVDVMHPGIPEAGIPEVDLGPFSPSYWLETYMKPVLTNLTWANGIVTEL